MKKNMWITVVMMLTVFVSFIVYLISFADSNVDAQSRANNAVSQEMMEELRKEQRLVQQERQRLQQYEQNLKNFESELDRRNTELLQRDKALKEKEEAFKQKLEDRTVDRQMIETYESIDPEQAAILVKNLYMKDKKLTSLLMRKIAGKKAGKILEAMIPLDREVSTQLAKETLDFYKPD